MMISYDIVTETINIELPLGNLNVLQIASILNNLMVNHVLVIYDSISNKFTFTRKHHPSPKDKTTILNCISCGNFLGFDNETEIKITHEGIKSTKKINVITLKATNIKVQGDINMINSTIDNFATSKFQLNNIIFHKVIDTKSNNVLGYRNSDPSNNFNYALSNNNSGQINFFSLTILDQDFNLIDDIDDFFLHLQFIKMKKQSMEFLLTKLVEYVKDIFLMIGNYLYTSKVKSLLEQQIYLTPNIQFRYLFGGSTSKVKSLLEQQIYLTPNIQFRFDGLETFYLSLIYKNPRSRFMLESILICVSI
jgi:hypothetical protein